MNNALTFDVEDYFQVSAFEAVVSRDNWHSYESRVHANTSKILGILDEADIKATFFILGWVAEKFSDVVREIAINGHEIACHGYSHKLVYNQSEKEFREETVKSKKILEDIVGETVRGYRAASYSITGRSLWALDILAECGFEYDSSIFPIRHDRYGIPAAPRFPHEIICKDGARLLEFPISTARVFGISIPVAGGGYFRLLPYKLISYGLSSINRREQRPFVFYLHPWELDPEQPRIEASRLSKFRHYRNLDLCEDRLNRLIKEYRFTTVWDVLREWCAANEVVQYPVASFG